MGIKRIVDVSFWTDGKVDDFSPEDKYFMLYLLTNPFTTQLGIYEISIKQVAFQLGYSMDAVKVLIDRFENKYNLIFYSEKTNEIAIKNFLKHSIIKGGLPVRNCLLKEMKQVKNRELLARVFAHIKNSEKLNETVKKIIEEYEEKNGIPSFLNDNENENDNDNDNDNENDNEVSRPYRARIVDESSQSTNNPQKDTYGVFSRVLLTDAEFQGLVNEFGSDTALKAITFLDEYIEEKEYQSNSHYLAIKRWVVDAVKEREKKEDKPKTSGNVFLDLYEEWK